MSYSLHPRPSFFAQVWRPEDWSSIRVVMWMLIVIRPKAVLMITLMSLHCICIVFSLYLHRICTIFASYLHLFCTVFAPYVQHISIVFAPVRFSHRSRRKILIKAFPWSCLFNLQHYFYRRICHVFAPYLHCIWTVCLPYLHRICSAFVP